ncbi:unnamed protein product [Staurois parvus]|uniref:Uncharacterized protein n=1 Tax=Staurois parvus TaxID=386267 RepID=A0ABN9EKH1_9NEOB|nr:unnamed protein product [Staurois parvus]
MGDMGSIL